LKHGRRPPVRAPQRLGWRALRWCRYLIRLSDRQLAAAPRRAGRWRPTWSPASARALLAALSLVLLLAVA
jgi:hypothetical protein